MNILETSYDLCFDFSWTINESRVLGLIVGQQESANNFAQQCRDIKHQVYKL